MLYIITPYFTKTKLKTVNLISKSSLKIKITLLFAYKIKNYDILIIYFYFLLIYYL